MTSKKSYNSDKTYPIKNSPDNNYTTITLQTNNNPISGSIMSEPSIIKPSIIEPPISGSIMDELPIIKPPIIEPFTDQLEIGNVIDKDVYRQLYKLRYSFENKKCLDIGTRNGINCITLSKLGAKEVDGIDIDDSRFNEMPHHDNINLFKQNLLEMDNTKKYDIITCFLWNMPFLQYDNIMSKIKSLLNENGIVYIGIYDDCYKYDEHFSVPKLLRRNFNEMVILDTSIYTFQWILRVCNPN